MDTTSQTVSYTITAEALYDAVRLHQTNFRARFRLVMLMVVLVGLILVLTADVAFGVGVATFGALMLLTTWISFPDRLIFRNRGRGMIGETCTYSIDERGLHYESPLGTGEMAWSAMTDVRSNDKSIAFGRDRVLVAYLPTSAFATPADQDAFLAFARAHVGKTAPPGSGGSA